MHRRSYLAGLGTAGITVLAGCSGNGGENGNSSGGETDSNDESEASTDGDPAGAVATEDEAIETGQAPPDETGTPFEETNTVPEVEGLETGQAPNATTEK